MKRFPISREELIARMAEGESFEFFFFWGHTPPNDGSVNRSCLSQWYEASFSIEGVTYRTAEHWMMADKGEVIWRRRKAARDRSVGKRQRKRKPSARPLRVDARPAGVGACSLSVNALRANTGKGRCLCRGIR